jgi:spermidine synthase
MSRLQPALLGLFLITGFTGLVYQLLWARMFTLVFGATVLAVSTVLAAFFAGLALGSWTFGRIVDRLGRPLLLYGLLELGIGFYAAFIPSMIPHAQGYSASLGHLAPDSFYGLSLARFVVCLLLMLLPTTLMGASLPVLGRFMVAAREYVGRDLGYLYAVNTIGAALGCLVTGFFLIEALGVSTTHTLAIVLNLAVGCVAVVLHRTSGSAIPEPQGPASSRLRIKSPDSGRDKRRRTRSNRNSQPGSPHGAVYSIRLVLVVLGAFGISGAAALGYEILWTRNLGPTLHSTSYSFTLILTAFLCGIGIGSFFYGKRWQRTTRPVFLFGAIQAVVGLYSLALIHFFRVMPDLAAEIIQPSEASWGTMTALQLLFCLVVMLIPTSLLGCTFPLASRICAAEMDRLGKTVGSVYAVNCVGGIAGSFLAGFVIIPTIGVKHGMMLVSAVSIAIALVVLSLAPGATQKAKRSAIAATMALAGVGLVAGYATDLYVGIGSSADARKLLYYKDGLVANVRVEQTADNVLLMIDNKVQAGRLGARSSQGLGHIPMLLHPDPRNVLTIGMGAGMTAGAVARHPVETIWIVDLIESLAETAPYFSGQNDDILKDERARFVVGDGRNFLLTTSERFDVIVADIFFPADAGTGSLYSLEHYEVAKSRLADRGMVVQWVPLYQLTEVEFRTIAATFLEVFPEAELWLGDPDMMYPVVGLVGRNGSSLFEIARLRQRLVDRAVSDGLVFGSDETSLLCAFLMRGRELAEFVAGAPLNTDDRPRIEFSAPRNDYTNRRYGWETIQKLARLKTSVVPLLNVESLGADVNDSIRRIERRETAMRHLYRGTFALGNGQAEDGFQAFREARALAPEDAFIDFHASESIGRLHAAVGDRDRAATLLEMAVRLRPDEPSPRLLLADLYAEDGRWELVEGHLVQVVEQHSEHAVALGRLGEVYALQGRWEDAMLVLVRALEILPVPSPRIQQLYDQALAHEGSRP